MKKLSLLSLLIGTVLVENAAYAATPLQPDKPATPLQAEKPAIPLQPDKPATPTQPDKPAIPTQPGTRIQIINYSGREYPGLYIYVGKLLLGAPWHAQLIPKGISFNTSLYSVSGNFKGMTITVAPGQGRPGPSCTIKNYPDISTPLIKILDQSRCTITSPLISGT